MFTIDGNMTSVVLILVSFLGLAAHWFKCNWRGQSACSLVDYLTTHKRNTIASIFSSIGAIEAMVAVGGVTLNEQSLAMAFMAGFTLDSTLNKGPED